ncbi:MFS transporter [Phreatobacter sp.]|uniref:MFS transporter n=1 Tax=Phreatobacter sp. TaxID=1966341 RepID=UPI003F70B2D1
MAGGDRATIRSAGSTGGAPPPFFGWRVVAGAFVLATCGWGLGFYGPPVFLHAIHEARGWPVSLVSAAVSVHFLVGAVTVANLPRLYGRFGLPRVTKAGTVIVSLGVVGWALAQAPWQLFVAAAFSGLGWVVLGAAAVNAIVAPWFAARRPAALAMAYNGASFGGILFSPLWVFAIGWLGFPLGALLIGLAVTLVVWLLCDRVFAHSPESLGQAADGGLPGEPEASLTHPAAYPLPGAALWRDRAFLTLTIGSALALVAQVGLIAHLFSLLVPALGTWGAGLAMSVATLAAIAGRTLVGWLMPDGVDRRVVASVSYGVQIAGTLAFLLAGGSNQPLLWIGVVLVGLGIGNLVSLPPLIAQVEFVRADVPRTVALIVAGGQAFYAFAPALFGLVRETFPQAVPGAAPQFYALAALLFALAIVLFLAGRRR